MSEIQKVLNLIRGGGGRKFSKSSELSEGAGGGGAKPNWEFFPNFPVFFFSDGSPYGSYRFLTKFILVPSLFK